MSRRLILLSLMIISILLGLLLCEAGARFYFWVQDTNYSVEKIRQDQDIEICSWPDTLYPHPYFGYVQTNRPPCGWPLSNIHLYGHDLPLKKNSDYFTVLVLGGSVAQNITSGFVGANRNWIEEELNKHYRSPDGRPFLVVNGALGGWKQPHQIIALSQYVDRIDAFISIEGYNENMIINSGHRLEQPFDLYVRANRLPDSPWLLTAFLNSLRNWILKIEFLKNSYIANLSLGAALNFFRGTIDLDKTMTDYSNFFQYPLEWPKEKRITESLVKYSNYQKSMTALAEAHSIQGAIFLQPIPNLYKRLTPRESKQGPLIDPVVYLRTRQVLQDSAGSKVPVFSLLKVFESETEDIYRDEIHCLVDEAGFSKGYYLMAKSIAQSLAAKWSLQKKLKLLK